MSNISTQYSPSHQVARNAKHLVNSVDRMAGELASTNETSFDLKRGDPGKVAGWDTGSYLEADLDKLSGQVESFRGTIPSDLFSRASGGSILPLQVSKKFKDGQPVYGETRNFGLTSTTVTISSDKTWSVVERVCGFPRRSYTFNDLSQSEYTGNWQCLHQG